MGSEKTSLVFFLIIASLMVSGSNASAQYYYHPSITVPIITAPDPPTALVAKAVSSTEIDLSWSPPSNNGGSPITSYKIYESINYNTNLVATTSSTSYQVANLSAGTTYTFSVTALNSAGEGKQSSSASETTYQAISSRVITIQPPPNPINPCPPGETLNSTGQCASGGGGQQVQGGGSQQCPPGYVFDHNLGQCVLQGGGALQCPLGYVYDHNVGQCVLEGGGQQVQGGGAQVPSWVKNNAKWWSEGQISQDEFLKGVQYLVQNKIINPTPTPPSFTQMKSVTIPSDCYIKIDGITGEYNAADLSGAIKVLLFYWSIPQSEGDHTSSNHQIYFVKIIDKVSPQISQALAKGQHFTNAQLECRKASSEQYLSYTMSDVIISSVSQINSGVKLPTEKVGLDFATSQTRVDTYNMVTQNQLNSQTPTSQGAAAKPTVPSWIKNNAKWWSEGQISQDEFLKGIQYLVQNNIISVNPHTYNAVQVAAPDCSLRGPGVNLQGCFLYQVNLVNADLTGANLYGATISSSNLMGIKLANADLTDASIEGSDVSSSDMSNAKTGGLFLNNADIRFANLHGDDLSKAYLSAVYHFSFDDLSDTNLSNAYLQHIDFSFANMEGTNLSFADLSYSTLYGADLTSAKLSCINLFHGDLRGAKLVSASFDDGNTHQRCVDLDQADLSGADLTNAYLSGADLPGADLSNAILTNADLSNTDLDGADLTGADLTGANLNYASLKGCTGYSGCH